MTDAPAKKPGLVVVKLLRGYFPKDDGKMVPPGTNIEVSVTHAKALIAGGQAVRTDPLPGEKADDN